MYWEVQRVPRVPSTGNSALPSYTVLPFTSLSGFLKDRKGESGGWELLPPQRRGEMLQEHRADRAITPSVPTPRPAPHACACPCHALDVEPPQRALRCAGDTGAISAALARPPPPSPPTPLGPHTEPAPPRPGPLGRPRPLPPCSSPTSGLAAGLLAPPPLALTRPPASSLSNGKCASLA